MTTRYYFIDSNINPDTIYGDQYPVCLPESEVKRLSAEYGVDLFEQMHEADADEIATYGIYDADKIPNFTAAVELMDDEIREEIHAKGTYTTEADAIRANLEDAALALNTVREKMLDAMLASQQSESGEWITSADFAELNAAERKLKDLSGKYAPAYKRMSVKDLF